MSGLESSRVQPMGPQSGLRGAWACARAPIPYPPNLGQRPVPRDILSPSDDSGQFARIQISTLPIVIYASFDPLQFKVSGTDMEPSGTWQRLIVPSVKTPAEISLQSLTLSRLDLCHHVVCPAVCQILSGPCQLYKWLEMLQDYVLMHNGGVMHEYLVGVFRRFDAIRDAPCTTALVCVFI